MTQHTIPNHRRRSTCAICDICGFFSTNSFVRIAALILALAISTTSHAQESIEVTIRANLGRASQVIIPQARSFIVSRDARIPPTTASTAAEIESVRAQVRILEQTAATALEINLRNPTSQQIEAVLLLPVPENAVVSQFAFEGSSSEPTAKVLSMSSQK